MDQEKYKFPNIYQVNFVRDMSYLFYLMSFSSFPKSKLNWFPTWKIRFRLIYRERSHKSTKNSAVPECDSISRLLLHVQANNRDICKFCFEKSLTKNLLIKRFFLKAIFWASKKSLSCAFIKILVANLLLRPS